jgi:predicted dehydrogenase
MHRIGVIGLGAMGTHMVRQFVQDSRFRVAAVWDANAERGRQLREEFPDVVVTNDAQSLMARDDVDLVYIATPPSSHVSYCHLALDHGKRILCEKPLSTDRAAAHELVQRVQAGKISCAVNFLFGLSPMVRAIETALQSGAVGDVVSVEVRMHFPKWPREWQKAADWLNGRVEGGFVREVFSHYAFLIDRVCGPLSVESRHVDRGQAAAEAGISAVMKSGDRPVRFIGAAGGAAPELIEWTLYGTRRSYRIRDWFTLQSSDGGDWTDVAYAGVDETPRPLDELARMMQGERHLLADFAAGLRAQEIIESLVG